MSNRLKILLWSVVVSSVLFFVVGPLIITKFLINTRATKSLSYIKIKASGKIATVGDYLVLTTPHGTNNYVLVGKKLGDLRKLADKGQVVFVFGNIIAIPGKIHDKIIRARIDVEGFDAKDFVMAQKISEEETNSIKRKVNEKSDFRRDVLKKLRISESSEIEAIAGKLVVMPNCVYATKPKETIGLVVVDKYGDNYLLLNGGGITAPLDKYKKFINANMDVVVIGHITLPDPSVMIPGSGQNNIPFSAKKIYNQDLSEFIALGDGVR